MRILFITATRLGDAVLTTGLLRHLRETHPSARFTICCGEIPAPLFAGMPGLERLIIVKKRRFDLHWLSLWRALAGTRFDLAIDLRGSALSFFLNARQRRILRGGRRPGHRLSHLGGLLGLDPAPLPIAFYGAAEAEAAARLLPHGPALIGLGPTANWAGKIWPAQNFAALFAALQQRLPGAVPVIFAGPGEAEAKAAAPLLAALPGAIDAVGRHSLPQIAALLARMDIFIGNDSGLMHLAAAAGAPTLGLFGPTSAEEYAPKGKIAAYVCAEGPAGAAPMTALSVEAAKNAAFSLLEAAQNMAPEKDAPPC